MSAEPQDIDLTKPKSWMEPTTVREADGTETSIPTREHHLLSDDNGYFPLVLNDWETEVLDTEMERSGFVAWYRNPSRSSQDSLAIAYDSGTTIKTVRPDFVFFSEAAGGIEVSIVDPHGFHLSDALPKLRGLAQYAEDHAVDFQRIETVAKVGNRLRVLDLTETSVRKAVADTEDAKALYEGVHASNY